MNLEKLRKYFFNWEALVHLVLLILYFTSVNAQWEGDWLDKSLRPEPPAPLSVLFFPIFFYLNAFWLIPKFLKSKGWIWYFMIAIPFFGGAELIRSLAVVVTQEQTLPFLEALTSEIFARDSFLFGWVSVAWLTFVFSFAYRFTWDWMKNNRTIERLESEKIAMELSLLKSQINPHFLFNNLNALDDLIDRDKEQAKKYLHRLSKLYRYMIQNMDKDVVTLKEEWEFIDDYTYLLEERFGKAYEFNKTNDLKGLNNYFIPPASLQSLIENAVKHNQGNISEPLKVQIDANVNGIQVSHKKRLKSGNVQSLGTGLTNLKSRYRLLTNEKVRITDDDTFSVVLPLINRI